MSVEMEKIPGERSNGRLKGRTSLGKKNIVKKGTIAVMEKVVVSWEVKGNVQRSALEFALQRSLDKTPAMMKNLHLTGGPSTTNSDH